MKHIQLSHAAGQRPFYFREASSDEMVVQQIFVNQDYSLTRLMMNGQINEFVTANMTRGLRPLIIDLGANIGASAMYFLLSYPNSRVVAVEPDTGNFELLASNSRDFDCIAIKGVAASQKGYARVCDPGYGHWGFRTEIDADGETETFTVPELMDKYGGEKFFPFIIKIDIEGAESELFSKNTDWIDAFPILIIELHDWLLVGSNSSLNFLKCVASRSRDFVSLGENVFSIRTPLDTKVVPQPDFKIKSTPFRFVASVIEHKGELPSNIHEFH